MNEMVTRTGNRIIVSGAVYPADLRKLCATLHQTITEAGFQDVALDFSQCTYVTEAVMLPLMPLIANYRNNGTDFTLTPPAEDNLKRLFYNTNWAHHINPHAYPPTAREGGHVPALCFTNSDMAYDIIERVMNLILRHLDTDQGSLNAVEWSLGEIMDNVTNHANSPVGGYVQATAYKQGNRVEFVVADAGIGIPQSMGIADPAQALRDAISEGVTSDPAKNAGNGLYGSYRVAFLSGGRFEIDSMNGSLFCGMNSEEVRSTNIPTPYVGTSVLCAINLADRDILSNALQFKGRLHDPPFGYVERRFENEEGELIFNMQQEGRRDFGSRQGGIRVRAMIENLLRSQPTVTIDLAGVGVFSSSFADEVFGRLFVRMGPCTFIKRITMQNIDFTVEGLIDRAIIQRTKLGDEED